VLRFNMLETQGARVAAFTERSDGDCASRAANDANSGRVRAARACGIAPERVVYAGQVHGNRVGRATTAHAEAGGGAFPATDALVTDQRDVPLGILVADCTPVYLLDPERPAIGLAHAGREGTRADIAGETVRAMAAAYGCEPARMVAVIGPSAGPDRYEVSEEMAAAWVAQGLPARGRLLDLWLANAGLLEAAGLLRERIHIAGRCTISDARFFSHRRDADGGRNLALLML